MGNVTQINVEGRNYNLVAGQAAKGACTTSAAAYEKVVVLPDSTDIVVGMLVAVTFVNGNAAGFSGKKTIYSSDGTNFYWDSNLTDPVVLPPEGCYIIENVSGQEYEYQAFPVLSVNGEVLPLCNSKGHPTGGPLWNAGDVVTFLYLEDRFIAILAEEGTDIKVYPTLADAQADLNNLSEGDIVGTEQGGDGAVDAVIAGDYRLVTSNAVAEEVNTINSKFSGLLKWVDRTYGNKTVGSGNYLLLESNVSNKHIICCKMIGWGTNTGCFSVVVYGANNDCYLIGNSGVQVTNLAVRFYYLDI